MKYIVNFVPEAEEDLFDTYENVYLVDSEEKPE